MREGRGWRPRPGQATRHNADPASLGFRCILSYLPPALPVQWLWDGTEVHSATLTNLIAPTLCPSCSCCTFSDPTCFWHTGQAQLLRSLPWTPWIHVHSQPVSSCTVSDLQAYRTQISGESLSPKVHAYWLNLPYTQLCTEVLLASRARILNPTKFTLLECRETRVLQRVSKIRRDDSMLEPEERPGCPMCLLMLQTVTPCASVKALQN